MKKIHSVCQAVQASLYGRTGRHSRQATRSAGDKNEEPASAEVDAQNKNSIRIFLLFRPFFVNKAKPTICRNYRGLQT